MSKRSDGRATIKKNGDVTTIRIVDYHGRPPMPAKPANPPTPININQDFQELKHIDIIAFSSLAEQEFLRLLNFYLDEMPEGVPLIGFRAEVAYKLSISTETSKRYIEKYCYSFSSQFKVIDGRIYRKEVKNSLSTDKGENQ